MRQETNESVLELLHPSVREDRTVRYEWTAGRAYWLDRWADGVARDPCSGEHEYWGDDRAEGGGAWRGHLTIATGPGSALGDAVRRLRDEAREARDHAQVDLCALALGEREGAPGRWNALTMCMGVLVDAYRDGLE